MDFLLSMMLQEFDPALSGRLKKYYLCTSIGSLFFKADGIAHFLHMTNTMYHP
jgi:hypothetical protein